ncbi:hypothetical protein AAFF_G00294010 [Aldrovandia affinis]|uniref:Uncharacterized protein n=1 Tax=Aldrovandia affinis TaxID=143900 RepID=A0AAD7W1V9_9TELE|nr:hypothetical protein AAFF_G00294010 [Aldrovandia affinis]
MTPDQWQRCVEMTDRVMSLQSLLQPGSFWGMFPNIISTRTSGHMASTWSIFPGSSELLLWCSERAHTGRETVFRTQLTVSVTLSGLPQRTWASRRPIGSDRSV